MIDVRQERGEQADRREKRTQRVDAFDADPIGQSPEHGGAHAAHAEREAKEHAGDEAHPSRDEVLRVDDDCREG